MPLGEPPFLGHRTAFPCAKSRLVRVHVTTSVVNITRFPLLEPGKSCKSGLPCWLHAPLPSPAATRAPPDATIASGAGACCAAKTARAPNELRQPRVRARLHRTTDSCRACCAAATASRSEPLLGPMKSAPGGGCHSCLLRQLPLLTKRGALGKLPTGAGQRAPTKQMTARPVDSKPPKVRSSGGHRTQTKQISARPVASKPPKVRWR